MPVLERSTQVGTFYSGFFSSDSYGYTSLRLVSYLMFVIPFSYHEIFLVQKLRSPLPYLYLCFFSFSFFEPSLCVVDKYVVASLLPQLYPCRSPRNFSNHLSSASPSYSRNRRIYADARRDKYFETCQNGFNFRPHDGS